MWTNHDRRARARGGGGGEMSFLLLSSCARRVGGVPSVVINPYFGRVWPPVFCHLLSTHRWGRRDGGQQGRRTALGGKGGGGREGGGGVWAMLFWLTADSFLSSSFWENGHLLPFSVRTFARPLHSPCVCAEREDRGGGGMPLPACFWPAPGRYDDDEKEDRGGVDPPPNYT